MSQVDTLRQEMTRILNKEAAAHSDVAKHSKDANKHSSDASKKREAAMKTKSASLKSSYTRAAERHEASAAVSQTKIASARKDLADLSRRKSAVQRSLDAAEKSDRDKVSREAKRERKVESDHFRQMTSLRNRTLTIAAPKPEALRVLYLTTNPDMFNSGALRTDAEVRHVQAELRGSRYRDQVELHYRPAATFEDMLDGMNDIRPHVIHFSGHGGNAGILFDNGSVDKPEGVGMDFDKLGKLLAATDEAPRLLVLNACDTLDGAEALLDAVPVVVAMSDSITDTAAVVFATKFYSAIASAQSIGSALKQAKAVLSVLDSAEDHLPNCVARDDVDIDELLLVKPT